MQCRKVAVLTVATDCEERNKQALLEIEKMSENNTMPPELLLLTLSRDPAGTEWGYNRRKVTETNSLFRGYSSLGVDCKICFDMESSEVTNVLENMTVNCREIRKVARFKGTLVFTDVGGRQVKWYNPSTKKVETLA